MDREMNRENNEGKDSIETEVTGFDWVRTASFLVIYMDCSQYGIALLKRVFG